MARSASEAQSHGVAVARDRFNHSIQHSTLKMRSVNNKNNKQEKTTCQDH